jgi:hypothetical protein
MSTTRTEAGAEFKCARLIQWEKNALNWRLMGPPLRPDYEDVALYIQAVREWNGNSTASRVLLLGVTPELYGMPWPEGTDFLAADRSEAMIEAVWPGPKGAALLTEWLDIKLPRGSRDIVLCDGGLHVLSYPEEQTRLVQILRNIVPNGGLCVFRLFLPPEHRESPDAVIDDLLAGKVPDLNVLKFRLWMALSNSASEGVEMATVYRVVHDVVGGIDPLAERTGWSIEHTRAINSSQDLKARLFFPTLDEVIDLFCGGENGFEMHRLLVPTYELGEQCPTIVLRRSSSAA